MKLGKIFILVLTLHVAVIGGILGYHFLKSKNTANSDIATQNVLDAAPSSINNKVVSDMDSASSTSGADLYATEIIAQEQQDAPVVQPDAGTVSTMEPIEEGSLTAPASSLQAQTPAVENPEGVFDAAPEVSSSEVPVEAPVSSVQAAEQTTGSYSVQKGDTLSKIARLHSVKVSTIKETNNLTTDHLKIGQLLVIPGHDISPVSGEVASTPEIKNEQAPDLQESAPVKQVIQSSTHTVKKGETLYRISREHKVSVQELKNANHLSSEVLRIGQTLTLPGKKVNQSNATQASTSQKNVVSSTVSAGNTYVVKKGDSLYGIARKHKVGINDILQANALKDASKITVGQKLMIPVKETTASSAPVSSATSEGTPVVEPKEAATVESKADVRMEVANNINQ